MTKRINKILIYTLAFVIIFTSVFPFLWMVVSGFKTKADILVTPFKFFPKQWVIENYLQLFINRVETYLFPKNASFLRSLFVTFGVAVIAMFSSLLINSMAAFAFARLNFPGKKTLWLYYALTMFIPNITILIPCFQIVNKLGLSNTIAALILPGIVYVWSIFFYRQFYLSMPQSIDDAARMDGCDSIQIYFKIYLPMSKMPFVIMGISVFQGYWNSYIWPTMVMQNPKYYQVNQLIAFFRSSQEISWNMLLASSSIAAIPMLVLLFVFQKYLLQGIKISGLK